VALEQKRAAVDAEAADEPVKMESEALEAEEPEPPSEEPIEEPKEEQMEEPKEEPIEEPIEEPKEEPAAEAVEAEEQ